MNPDDTIRVSGKVLATLPGPIFRVQLPNGFVLIAHLPHRHRERGNEMIPGREVALELSPYDLSRGRIVLPSKDPSGPGP